MFKALRNLFLKIFGDIKVFRWPFFLLYHPTGYQVKGDEVRQVIDTIRPGDILVRGYRNYLDGLFIPGYFSHVGLYLGEVTDADRQHVTHADGERHFRSGKQMVIHSMAEGIFLEDVINFCRCDRMAILRFPAKLTHQQGALSGHADDSEYTERERELRTQLEESEDVTFDSAFEEVFKVALAQLGKSYDFGFNFSNFNDQSCSEFVYYTIKSLEWFHGIYPRETRVFLMKRTVLYPDDFAASALTLQWKSASANEGKIAR